MLGVILVVLLVFFVGVKFGVLYFSDVVKFMGNEFFMGEFDIGISRDDGRYYDVYKVFEFGDFLLGEEKMI